MKPDDRKLKAYGKALDIIYAKAHFDRGNDFLELVECLKVLKPRPVVYVRKRKLK